MGKILLPFKGLTMFLMDLFFHIRGFLILNMIRISEICHNLSSESPIFQGYCEIMKGIFIHLEAWFGKVNEPTDEVYER
jgi:hypothetical protein